MNDFDFDFSDLNYAVLCNCKYSISDRIGVRSTFQGAIPCFLCCRNSNASYTVDNLKFIQEYYTK